MAIAGPAMSPPVAADRKPNWLLTSVVSAGAGGALNGFLEGGGQSFHFGDEGWFSGTSHYGGADKAASTSSTTTSFPRNSPSCSSCSATGPRRVAG